MNLLQSLRRRSASTTQRYDGVDFSGVDPLDFAWSFGGNSYMGIPGATGYRTETLESSFLGLVQGAFKRNGVIFACMRARLSVFSEGRFMFQRFNNGTPGDLFGSSNDGRTAGSSGLRMLENPWPNGTTGDLLTRTLQDADLAGNAYWTVRNGNLRRMRPDWVSIVMGSRDDSRVGPDDLDAELLGYFYSPGGPMNKTSDPVFLLPDEVAHFAPMPDPIAHYRGMSWLTPVIREVEADTAATVHKLAFFQNGATLQTIISFKDMKQEVFEAFVKKMDLAHKGAQNAYKTLYLGGGADATVVGADLRQLDFKATQGAGETRIAAAAGVPPAIVGLSEGLQGSSLNAGNLGQLRRQFAEGTLSTLWRNAAASFATLVPPPSGSQLVVDTRFIPFLREDHQDRANVQQVHASTIVSLATGGFTRDSAIKAVVAEDMTLLVEDPNWVSVQLQQAGGPPSANPPAVSGGPKARAAIAARAFNPLEPRDPHSGKWMGDGVPDAHSALAAAARISGAQYAAMRPESMWSEQKRDEILTALKSSEDGKVLADVLDRFQDGGSISRLRTNMEKRLGGESTGNATSDLKADVVIDALRHAPPDMGPATAYRGMSVKGSVQTVLGRYKAGEPLDLNLTSFSSDRGVAKRFQQMTHKTGQTRVMVELVGDGKRLIPIQNLARDRRLFKEKEWVGAGRYEIVEAKKSGDGGVLLRIRQVGAL